MICTFLSETDSDAYDAMSEADLEKNIRDLGSNGTGVFQVEIDGTATVTLYGRVSQAAPWAFVAELSNADLVVNNTAGVGVRLFPFMGVEAVISSGTVGAWVGN